jgi:hypothetical protein
MSAPSTFGTTFHVFTAQNTPLALIFCLLSKRLYAAKGHTPGASVLHVVCVALVSNSQYKFVYVLLDSVLSTYLWIVTLVVLFFIPRLTDMC